MLNSAEIFILAGGQSRRMGRDKAALPLFGTSLLEHVRRRAEQSGLPAGIVRRDAVSRCGPLGGIYTALRRATRPWVFILACDMPLVSPGLLFRLLFAARPRDRALYLASRNGSGFPLLLRRDALPQVQAQIRRGLFSVQSLAQRLRARAIPVEPARQIELLNLNTPAQLKKARRLPRRLVEEPILEVASLSLRRGATLILSQIDWRIRRGEHWVILGANGSGKSSLLCAIAGYAPPSGGLLRVLGRTFGRSDWRELRKRIGLVSAAVAKMMADDEPALETVLSGRAAMIDYWGHPSPAERRRAQAILRAVECAHLADRPWRVLSQGERQRLLIGRAWMAAPDLLILDEPCAGLDPAAREHFLEFINRLGRRPRTPSLVLVTHHVEEIMPVFTHALLLRRGRVLRMGPLADALQTPILSEAFESRARLVKRAGRYALRIAPNRRRLL